MKIASKNTETKHTLARGSAKMLRKLAITAARLNGAGGGVTTPRKAKNATIVTIDPNRPRMANTPRQPSRSPITPGDGRAQQVAGEPDRQQPADRHLALIDRHEIADQRHRHGEYAARDQSGRDPHGDHQREAGGHRADEGREGHDEQAQVHQPGLAEEIAGDAERRLHQRIGEGEGAREQRSGLHIDREVGGDHRDHGIDRAGEQRLRKDHEGDDFQDRRNGRLTRLFSNPLSFSS